MKSGRLKMTIWRPVLCWISKATCTQAHAHASAPSATPTQTHTHTHTHTEKYVTRISFPQQQLLSGFASVLRYTYISCLVISLPSIVVFTQNWLIVCYATIAFSERYYPSRCKNTKDCYLNNTHSETRY
jgi:hypothetical protein